MIHTKGPWQRRQGIWSEQIENEYGTLIADASGLYKSKNEAEANAQLISAAPELLHALLNIYEELKRHWPEIYTVLGPNFVIAMALNEQALKKAVPNDT